MPPKVDVKTLMGKLDNALKLLCKLMEEFETIFSVKPELKTLEAAFSLVETKYRLVKKQQETILDRLVKESTGPEDELVLATKKPGDKTKPDFLQITLKFAAYQKEQNSSENSNNATTLEALTLLMSSMTSAVQKMVDNIGSKLSNSSLQRLPVPVWDGTHRTYATWKKEFSHWMKKYGQDKDEQLQHFRNATPKGSFRTDQVKLVKPLTAHGSFWIQSSQTDEKTIGRTAHRD